MQLLELLAVSGILVVAALLFRAPLRRFRDWSAPSFNLAVGLAVGLLSVALVAIARFDLVPDDLEVAARPFLFGTLVVGLIALARRALTSG